MKKLILLLAITTLLSSCSKDENSNSSNTGLIQQVNVVNVNNILFTSALCNGKIGYNTGTLHAGICYSTTSNPTILGLHTDEILAAGTTTFTSALQTLQTNTLYYIRPYVIDGGNTIYGPQTTFKTLAIVATLGGGVQDIDGESYSSVMINGKEWMSKNLNVSKYTDGTVIPQVTDITQWNTLTTGAWCYYENDTANGPVYGKLYNWYAVAGIYDSNSLSNPSLRKKIAPIGWHIPSKTEWSSLSVFLGGDIVSGSKLKDNMTSLWDANSNFSSNQAGFDALPSGTGYLNYHSQSNNPTLTDVFSNKTKATYWWSATATGDTPSDVAYSRNVTSMSDQCIESGILKSSAISVRCVKD